MTNTVRIFFGGMAVGAVAWGVQYIPEAIQKVTETIIYMFY